MAIWNPWHGCHKISPGCAHCYVYRRDESVGRDASVVTKTADFDLPLRKNRQGAYKLTAAEGTVYACMTSDFFLEDADAWRQDCWDMIRERRDLSFHIITKRIDRFAACAPPDWGGGWEHVTVCSTCEDQDRADYRLPILLSLPIRHRTVICEPMLGEITLEDYLKTGKIEHVVCGGESGPDARPCRYDWVLKVRGECVKYGVPFTFKQTGAVFVKDGRTYRIDRKFQMAQAKKAGIDYFPERTETGDFSTVFDGKPTRWGLRGDPYFWDYLQKKAQRMARVTPDGLEAWILSEYKALTGCDMTPESVVRVEAFSHGGMSSGEIAGAWWFGTGIPLLKSRLED